MIPTSQLTRRGSWLVVDPREDVEREFVMVVAVGKLYFRQPAAIETPPEHASASEDGP
jgi:hypothetical protein